ncbi:MAG TPA: site-specific DNA-methyltransferase [Candidatus Cloacimonetes bacterium]|nr:site-specific DNA-methyltransferase [Candidatus Cloacimonadota bacterium]
MKNQFLEEGYSVVDTDRGVNKLLAFLKEHYPSIIKDNEIDLNELKAAAGLPIDEKVNGYGLNFVGRNFARAKYSQETDKELRLNTTMSKDIDTTQNLVLKGDNLDSLKILKSHYTGKIKCIYIDPPYNTDKDEFIYPDKFNKEEAEVLGLVNLSEDDFARMDFSFKTKKSHNGWLSFMYPRLLLARDLLSNDGVIFISIDDNEQANLKLLCDDVFGEENFVGNIVLQTATDNNKTQINTEHEYILVYAKSKENQNAWESESEAAQLIEKQYLALKKKFSNDISTIQIELRKWIRINHDNLPRVAHYDNVDEIGVYHDGDVANPRLGGYVYDVIHPDTGKICKVPAKGFRFPESTMRKMIAEGNIQFGIDENILIKPKIRLESAKDILRSVIYEDGRSSTNYVESLLDKGVFDNPKSHTVLKRLFSFVLKENDIILDFFAGSGTTGDAVMQLNAEDGGNRKFILCQIDEAIEERNPAHKFCLDNNLPPVISSITIERLRRAGDKIVKEIEDENGEVGFLDDLKKDIPDVGFKVFDSVDAPKLEVEDGEIMFPELIGDTISRIYNMIFTVGLDEPTQVPEEVVKDCIYKIENNYYITNSTEISNEDFADAIKNGKVFIDGWTASLNSTLQHYKEDVKIVF